MDLNGILFPFDRTEAFINTALGFFFAGNTACFLSFLYIHRPAERLHEKNKTKQEVTMHYSMLL